MELGIKLQGVPFAEARLATVNRSIEPVLRGALNTTATSARRERYTKPLRVALPSRRLNRRLVIKRARRGRMDARIIPSSSGIAVTEYSRWGFDPIDRTRARVWVMGPSGKKIAAGFVNPSGRRQAPLGTRSEKRGAKRTYTYQRALGEALAPSAAFWFKQLSGGATVRWVNGFLQREFERRIRLEIAKGVR
ncbi:hypothetical protein ACFSB1_10725 [Halopseudomonas phragmitis]|uniref:Uncharacterized protein n=1 Tax=Halopseudomonas phragmitis TaxID=1931241 RepID=A0A1V0B9E2_9GAMM|nr:hypothetical protein [Halopseudomonas phragmitis]AQZ96558.1 hypothetical protein BVH74_18170 [Halopseudomonas phragmitis]